MFVRITSFIIIWLTAIAIWFIIIKMSFGQPIPTPTWPIIEVDPIVTLQEVPAPTVTVQEAPDTLVVLKDVQ